MDCKKIAFAFTLIALFGLSKSFGQLPDEFQTQDLITGLANATTFKFAPDGRIFILDRYGELIVYKQDTQSSVTAGELDVFHELEDGLLGIAFDPDFESNGFIYLHYSPLGVTVNRVSRFLMEGDDLNLSSEVVVLEWPTQRDNYFHAGGDMGFDSQGNLYIATGDNSNHSPFGAFNENDENQSAENTASNTNDLRGKILRITPQPDGSYTIPPGNLFAPGTPSTLPEIYVMGARNPYRIHVDAEFDDWLFWGEVGPDSDEDSMSGEGPVGLDEINLTKEAGNYGWPYFSGNGINDANTVGGNDDSAFYEYLVTYGAPPYYNDPSAPQNNSIWNTGVVDLPPAQPAWLDFFHRSYMAGPRYKFNASLTDLQRLPVEFDGRFFFYDFNFSKIWSVEMDANGDILSLDQLAPSVFPKTADGFIDMEIGPDGFMYILAYGAGCCPQNVGTGRLMKVIYTGITTNTPPNAIISADVTNGALPLTVNFSSAGTSDPNGDTPLSYEWDFDTSTPSTDSTDENPSHTYITEGVFNAQLRVDDGNGGIGVANITITAGNTAAEFTFNSPTDGGFYNWDDDITLDLFVSDAEDGDTSGGSGTEGSGIDCSDIDVVPSLGHLTHFHDTPTIDGCSPQVLTIMSDDGHQTNGEADLFFVLNALYTDTGGFDSQDQIRIYPKRAEAEHFDDQIGTEVISNTDLFGGGEEAIRVDNDSFVVFEGRNLQNINAVSCRVTTELSGGTIEFRVGGPAGTLLSEASVPETGDLSTWANVEMTFTDPGGKNDLYFIFRHPRISEDIMDVNYIEFLGAGISVDNSPPVVDEVRSLNTTQVRVLFSEYVTDATAGIPTNYQLDNGITIGSADLLDDRRTVILTTSMLSPSTVYELTVSNVQNEAGLTMITDSFPFSIFNPVRINAGGGELNTSYGFFEADQFATGGEVFTNSIAIENTSDDILYQSERYDDFVYEIPILVSGEYDIRLHFAEIFLGVGGNTGGAGDRLFNVSIEGQEVLSNFDMLAETSPATALIKEFDDVLISDGAATIEFTGITGDAKISGIEILSPDAFAPTPSISILSPMDGWDVNQPFEVSFSIQNWDVAVGSTHMHYYVDGVMIGAHYSFDPIVIEGYSEGPLTVRVELFNANHTGTGIFDEVTVNITNTLTCNEAPFPDEWTVHELEDSELPHRAVYIYADDDLDGDGLKDIVAGAWWYKNPGSASGNWVRNDIGAPLNNVAFVHDFDGDGDMDLLGTQGSYESSDMAWGENDGTGNFTVRTNIPSGTNTFSEPFLAGIAGAQFTSGGPFQMAINWNGAEATGDPMQLLTPAADLENGTWTFEDLSPDSLGEDINEGDIDGDGDLDLFQGGNWLRNDISDGGGWTTIPTGITYVTTVDRAQLADFDRDGDLDAVVGQLGLGSDPDRFEFSWFEAPANPEDPWIRHILATDIAGSLSVFTVDMDFDGDEDIIVGEWLGSNRLIAFENDLCNSGTWIQQTIDAGGSGIDHHDGARVTDIDNDGDLDIVSIGWNNIIPRIFENTTINASDPTNQNPVVINPGLQLYNEGVEVSLQIEASDPNFTDVLTYSAANLPPGLTINGTTGAITGVLGTGTIGEFSVSVRATDQEGAFDEQTFTMNIGTFDTLIRINAGGPEVTFGDERWVEDIYFSGGETFTVTNAITNTENDAIFQTERNTGASATDLIYEIPVPESGNYGVRLYFAETFHATVGARVFDVDIEGGQGAFNNYDIVQRSGGQFTAVMETFLVNVMDGSLTIDLSTEIDRAKISGIEILGTNNDVPPVVVNPGNQILYNGQIVQLQIQASDIADVLTYAATGLPENLSIDEDTGLISGQLLAEEGDFNVTVRATDLAGAFDEETFTISVVNFPNPYGINSGGPQLTFNGDDWIEDQFFTGGSLFSTTEAIENTDNDELYQTERFAGSTGMLYEIPVPNDTEFEIRLHFAELFHGVGSNGGGIGSRVFNVDIENGQGQLQNYDIIAEAGNPLTAAVESFVVNVNDGDLSISFTNVTDFAKISGIEIIRRQAPNAVALATPESGTVPLEVSFTGDQSGDDGQIVAYAWDFKDGTTSTEANPVHTFTDANTYDVELTVTDDQGFMDTTSVTIVANEVGGPPTAVATAVPLTGSAPLEVSFTGDQSSDDGDIVGYAWDFMDGTTSTEANPTHTFTNPDTYEVELTVTDDSGLTDTTTIAITVTDPNEEGPTAVASATPITGEAPLEVSFTGDQSTVDDGDITDFTWDFADGNTSTEVNPVHTFMDPGTYMVELTVTDESGLTDTATITITATEIMVNNPPEAIIQAETLFGDAPLSISFSGTASTDDVGIVGYSWDFGNGATSTEEEPTVTFEEPGEYTVTLTVEDAAGETDQATVPVEVIGDVAVEIGEEAIIVVNPPETEFARVVVMEMRSDVEVANIYLHDSVGRLVGVFDPQDVSVGANSYDIPIVTLRSEVYYVTLQMRGADAITLRLLVNN
ncbi:MAG: PKD domain-containing protein [Bacteroidota bacterium]